MSFQTGAKAARIITTVDRTAGNDNHSHNHNGSHEEWKLPLFTIITIYYDYDFVVHTTRYDYRPRLYDAV